MVRVAARSSPAETIDDGAIVARVRGGESSAFELLIRRHNLRMYRVVRAVLRDDSEVEDVMQQAWVAAFVHLDQFAGQASFATWLVRIGVNEALGRVRQRRRHVQLVEATREDTPMSALPSPEEHTSQRQLAALLEEAIDRLPDTYREVFVLRLVEQLDTLETAQALSISGDLVKQRLHRARALVQRHVEDAVGAVAHAVFEFHAPRCDRVTSAAMAVINAG